MLCFIKNYARIWPDVMHELISTQLTALIDDIQLYLRSKITMSSLIADPR